MTYEALYRHGRECLSAAKVPDAGTDARLLLEWCCGTDRNTLLSHGGREVSAVEYDQYREALKQRASRLPLQYITGEQDFMGLTFRVNAHVLVPRPDTEILVEEAMRNLHDGMRILDVCTGSGCILLSLLRYSNDCSGVGVDLSPEALQVARENAARIMGANPEDGRISFLQGDLFQALPQKEKFDMIVSNPPYIKTGVIDTLMPEVRDFEPRLALDGGEDGLLFYREIIRQAGVYLYSGGMLLLEIGYDQGEAVSGLMESAGYMQVEIYKDYAGNDRVVEGIWQDNPRA